MRSRLVHLQDRGRGLWHSGGVGLGGGLVGRHDESQMYSFGSGEEGSQWMGRPWQVGEESKKRKGEEMRDWS